MREKLIEQLRMATQKFGEERPVEWDAADAIEKLQSENERFFYELEGVMHSVDKWLDAEERENGPTQRACDMREKTLRIVEALQAENAQLRKEREWISVTERLPKKMTNKVIVHCKNGYIGFGHYEDYKGNKDWYNLENGELFSKWNLEDCEPYEVAHWMPLPEPPKEETQQDCTYNKDGHCIGQKLMPECDAKSCDRRK